MPHQWAGGPKYRTIISKGYFRWHIKEHKSKCKCCPSLSYVAQNQDPPSFFAGSQVKLAPYVPDVFSLIVLSIYRLNNKSRLLRLKAYPE
jgi:hypothetical protein